MSDPLADRWRPEFPIVDTCTYLVSHSLGAMPRRAVDERAGVRRQLDDARRARLVGGLVGDGADGRRHPGADHRRAARIDLDAPERQRRAGHHRRRASASTVPRRRIVMSSPRVSDEHLRVRRLSPLRRRDRPGRGRTDGIRTDLQRLLDAIDERTLLVPLSLVLFRSSFIQDARAGRSTRPTRWART